MGAVSDGGGYSDDGTGRESADDGGECAFHAGDGDNAAGLLNGLGVGEEAMDTGYAGIINFFDASTGNLCGLGGFFGDG